MEDGRGKLGLRARLEPVQQLTRRASVVTPLEAGDVRGAGMSSRHLGCGTTAGADLTRALATDHRSAAFAKTVGTTTRRLATLRLPNGAPGWNSPPRNSYA